MSDDPKTQDIPELQDDEDIFDDFEDSLFPRQLSAQDEHDLETLRQFNY